MARLPGSLETWDDEPGNFGIDVMGEGELSKEGALTLSSQDPDNGNPSFFE